MRVSRLVIAGLLVAAAASLARAIATRHGVGPVEYLTSILLVVLLVRLAFAAAWPGRHA